MLRRSAQGEDDGDPMRMELLRRPGESQRLHRRQGSHGLKERCVPQNRRPLPRLARESSWSNHREIVIVESLDSGVNFTLGADGGSEQTGCL